MNTNQAGKGDKPRPVDKKSFNNNFDQINWTAAETSKEAVKKKGKTTYKY